MHEKQILEYPCWVNVLCFLNRRNLNSMFYMVLILNVMVDCYASFLSLFSLFLTIFVTLVEIKILSRVFLVYLYGASSNLY